MNCSGAEIIGGDCDSAIATIFDHSYLPNTETTPSSLYFSSSLPIYLGSPAWVVIFNDGNDGGGHKFVPSYVRFVRESH